MTLQHRTHVTIHRDGVVGRRDFLKVMSAAGGLSLVDAVSLHAAELRKQGMACILLWMQGGPSQFDTFDPKPAHANGAEVKAISTRAAGVQIAANLPKLANQADKLAIVRSMTTKEGNHQRATYLMHTSYVPSSSVNYPTLGAAVSHASAQSAAAGELPAFVRIGRTPNGGNGGFLGTEFDALQMQTATRLPDNVKPTTDVARYQRRLGLLGRLEGASGPEIPAEQIADHRKLYDQASRMILSPSMEAFDITREPDSIRDGYGRGEFGAGCLLARRLVESGVTFVEVSLGNWDTHQDNNQRTQQLCGQLDQPFAFLLEDLAQRGMLERTMVVWMGEFGRTPRINPRNGRDHYPRAFSAALAGAGVRGGQVIGATDESGSDVEDAPVTEKDMFQTIYKGLKIDAAKENMSPIGRPIKLVDGGAAAPVFG